MKDQRGLRAAMVLTSSLFPPLHQVDEIYHDESLGVHINIVLVRMIMVGYRQVNTVLGCGEEMIGWCLLFCPLARLELCPMREGESPKRNTGASGSYCFSQGRQACGDTLA